MLGDGRLVTQRLQARRVESGGSLDQLLLVSAIVLPPLIIGDRAPVAQQIGIPVLTATDAAVARLEPTNTGFHVIVGAWELLLIVALHQVGPQVGEDLQELGKRFPLLLRHRAITEPSLPLLPPAIHATSDRC